MSDVVTITETETLVVTQESVSVIQTAGTQGPPGPPGPAGTADKTTVVFSAASANWQVLHNTGKRPVVTVLDAFGHVVIAEVEHLSSNEFYVRFGSPQTGSVIYI